MSYSKETIWHFTCKFCKGWWSIAAEDDGWSPRFDGTANRTKNLYCPHCGRECRDGKRDSKPFYSKLSMFFYDPKFKKNLPYTDYSETFFNDI